MTVDPSLAAFLGVAALIVVSPGPDSALVVRNTFLPGRPAGAATVGGIMCGIAAWALAAAVALAAILEASAAAFTALKLAGAAYLIVLGLLTLRGPPQQTAGSHVVGPRLAARRAWTLGWLSASLNPKLGVFFLSLLPQFAEPGVDSPARLLMLAVLFGALGTGWLLLVVEVVARSRAAVGRPWARRAARWVTGAVLVGLGARERRRAVPLVQLDQGGIDRPGRGSPYGEADAARPRPAIVFPRRGFPILGGFSPGGPHVSAYALEALAASATMTLRASLAPSRRCGACGVELPYLGGRGRPRRWCDTHHPRPSRLRPRALGDAAESAATD